MKLRDKLLKFAEEKIEEKPEETPTPLSDVTEKVQVQKDKEEPPTVSRPTISERVLQKAKELGIPEELIVGKKEETEVEVGVPYIPDKSMAKIVIDRKKPPKYSPLGIILPATEEKGKIVDLSEKKVIEGEGDVPAEFYDDASNVIQEIEKLLQETQALKNNLSKLQQEYYKYIAPIQNEISEKEDRLNSKVLELFWILYNAGVKAVKIGNMVYKLKAQLERTGKMQKDKIEEIIHLFSKVFQKAFGFTLNVKQVLQSLMGTKLVVELDRMGDFSTLVKSLETSPTQSLKEVNLETGTPTAPIAPTTQTAPTPAPIAPGTTLKASSINEYMAIRERVESLVDLYTSEINKINKFGDLVEIALEKLSSYLEEEND